MFPLGRLYRWMVPILENATDEISPGALPQVIFHTPHTDH
jgi:hypothetical protein